MILFSSKFHPKPAQPTQISAWYSTCSSSPNRTRLVRSFSEETETDIFPCVDSVVASRINASPVWSSPHGVLTKINPSSLHAPSENSKVGVIPIASSVFLVPAESSNSNSLIVCSSRVISISTHYSAHDMRPSTNYACILTHPPAMLLWRSNRRCVGVWMRRKK